MGVVINYLVGVDLLPRLGGAQPTGGASWKPLIRERFGLTEDDVVLVSSLACSEPGCPPRETVIVVMETEGARTWKIPLPPEQLTATLVTQTLDEYPNGNNHHD